MPSRLKSFELHGYKTFASRNEFVFSDGITAIVGPNGSGKSNIADALRWVLGEQSYGLLRAKKTEDMIFSGSENRPRAGMASATVIFDNSDAWLPIDFVEVGITRRAYRDGDNEYLLNGQRVRLKDVSEILAKSGLAERTYTIIGQGLVDAALSLKAEERRRLFEEAAGIGLYRARREESLKRLESTRRNLERVQDILAELQPRLRSLERQARRAQEYEQMKADLKIVLREWYGYHWHKAQAELVETQVNARKQELALNQVQSSQLDLDRKLGLYRQQIDELRSRLNEWHKQLTALHGQRETLSREQAVNNERCRLLIMQLEQVSHAYASLEEQAGIERGQLDVSKQELEQLHHDLEESRQSQAEAMDRLNARQVERSKLEALIQSLAQKVASLVTQSTQLQARISEKETHAVRLERTLQEIDREIASKELELSGVKRTLKSILLDKEDKDKDVKDKMAELQQAQEQLTRVDREQKDNDEKLSAQKTRIAQLQAEIHVLEEAEKSLAGYEEGARILIQAMQEKRIEGTIGILGSSLDVPEEYETAIAAILGEFIDSLVIKSLGQADQALDLIESETTRGSLFPLDSISAMKPQPVDLGWTGIDPAYVIGCAADLIGAETQLKPIVELLFRHTILVKDRRTARNLLTTGDWHTSPDLRIVTLKGEIFHASGFIISGASGKVKLARPRQQRETKTFLEQAHSAMAHLERDQHRLERRIEELQQAEKGCDQRYRLSLGLQASLVEAISQRELEVDRLQQGLQLLHDQQARYRADRNSEEEEIQIIKTQLFELQAEMKQARQELASTRGSLNALPLEDLQAQNAYWTTNTAVVEQALLDAEHRQHEKMAQVKQIEDNLAISISRTAQLEADIRALKSTMENISGDELQINAQIDEISQLVNPQEEQLSSLEKEHNLLLSTDTQARQVLRSAEQRYTQAKIALAQHQEAFESLRRHIEDDFGLVAFEYTDTVSGPKPLPLDGMVEQLPKVETMAPELEETIHQQKALIRRMGAINPEAQAEYQEVKERFEFLTSQVEDLNKAEEDIKEVIAELDLLMEREFRRTFDAVAQEFRQIFTRLFGGGSARLALTDPENMTETGIDIEARLPGRREQGLALLSGGERSLTATALVFALLRVSPTPFCVLDEVDAMLDEANVGRFRDLLTELSEKTQFIVITHNRNTVQAASIIYGVTMGRDSASQVISLKMDEIGEEFGV